MSGHGAPHGADHGHSGGGGISESLKAFANPFVGGEKVAKVLNNDQSAVAFNSARRAEAAKEMSPDISTTITAVKTMVSSIMNAVKATVKAPLIAATDIVTNTVAIPANIARAT